MIINVVICNEKWIENHSRSTGKTEEMETRYAWVSSRQLSKKNLFNRCTKIARCRWLIEENFLIEKHDNFEHCYSYDWQAMKGFHYLMKIGHFLNVLAVHSELIQEYVEDSGSRGFIARFYESLEGVPLDTGNLS